MDFNPIKCTEKEVAPFLLRDQAVNIDQNGLKLLVCLERKIVFVKSLQSVREAAAVVSVLSAVNKFLDLFGCDVLPLVLEFFLGYSLDKPWRVWNIFQLGLPANYQIMKVSEAPAEWPQKESKYFLKQLENTCLPSFDQVSEVEDGECDGQSNGAYPD